MQRPSSAWACLLVAAAVNLGRVAAAGSSADTSVDATAGTSTDLRGPVVIVGMDGMTFDVLDPLIARGDVPNLAELMGGGARAVLLSEKPMRSPALWTTIATGQPRRTHGIYDFVTGSSFWPRAERDVPQRLVTSDMRRAPALWNLAGPSARSLVVGWLNSWPAEEINGVMVAPYVALGQLRQTSIKGKLYADVGRQVFPPVRGDEIRGKIMGDDEVPLSEVRALMDEPAADAPLYTALPRLRRYLYTVRWSIASTLTNTQIAVEELRREPFDLVMTYFDGSDTLAHRFWLFRQPESEVRARLKSHGIDPNLAPELKARFGQVLEGYYRLVDRMIGELRDAAGPDATFLVVSDHGWMSLPPGYRAPYDHVPFDGDHALEGAWLAHGPAIQPGVYPPLTLYDVAPTTLALLGMPVPEALPGRVAHEMLAHERIEVRPILFAGRGAPSAAPAHPTPRDDVPFEAQEIERLRSLGYVQ